jgi:AraC family transcriptional regulator
MPIKRAAQRSRRFIQEANQRRDIPMNLANKALWTIERNLDRDLDLGEIARSCGVSRYHLAHAFGTSVGLSVMHYVRARRLSAAAQALARGAPDILHLALETGYASHEAFSRAFRAQFGATPEMVRCNASTEDLPMIKPMNVSEQDKADLEPPRFETGAPMQFVGLSQRHAFGSPQGIPAQWQKFMTSFGDIQNRSQPIPVGLSMDMDDDGNFEYVCAAEVSTFSATPRGLIEVRVPTQNYAVFLHSGHVSKIGATYAAIWNEWLPNHQRVAADGVSLERHRASFDPRTGMGGVEIWIPLK